MEGTGVYIRKLSTKRHGTPKQAAKRAKDHGLTFVPIMGAWQQPRKDKVVRVASPNKRDVLARYVDAFFKADIAVGLWYYPWAGHEDALLEVMREQTEGLPIEFWLNDAELGYKWKKKITDRALARQLGTNMRSMQPEAIRDIAPKGTKPWVIAGARKLMEGVEEAKSDGIINTHGSTAYGIAKFHPNFPWETFLQHADWLSPQLYTATARQVDMGIDQWYELDPKADAEELRGRPRYMVPSIGTYGAKSGPKMHEHLSSFVDSNEGVDGFCAWSWMQTNSQEWQVLARWAEWLRKGACAL
jgi:hypothetical protein